MKNVSVIFLCVIMLISFCLAQPAQEKSTSGAATVRLHLRDKVTSEKISARTGFLDKQTWEGFRRISGFMEWGIKQQSWWTGGGEIYRYARPDCEFKVSAGKCRLVVNRGIEYVPQIKELDPAANSVTDVTIEMRRWINLAERGWYCGDTHLHIARFSAEHDEALFELLETEGLNVAPLVDWSGRSQNEMVAGWGGWTWTPELLVAENRKGDIIICSIEDWAWPKKSCVLKLLGHKTPITTKNRYAQAAIIQKALAEGGVAAGSLGTINTEAALLGKISATESLAIDHFTGTRPWYDLLNVGCRIAAVAGTDVQSQAKPRMIGAHYAPVGADRFYVYLPEGLDRSSFIEGIRAGRTFVTNGPALFLAVNSEMAGGEVKLESPAKVRVLVEVVCPVAVAGKLTIIKNGRTEWEKTLDEGQRQLREQIDMDIDKSCWLAARFESDRRIPGSELPKAHTSPVYITLDERAVFTMSSYTRVMRGITSKEIVMASDATDEEKAIAIEWIDRAKKVLEERRKSLSK